MSDTAWVVLAIIATVVGPLAAMAWSDYLDSKRWRDDDD